MPVLECSAERPWGVHAPVRNDAACGRCGWVAPGPISDALDDAREAAEAAAAALARAEQLGWAEQPIAA
ncbi:MAG TPA: hypothetical protein VGC56_19190 [Allosphingosinicella sp.]|jgi:hypothetical protein